MTAIDMARSHVERCLQDIWSVEHVVPDADGDYPYGIGTASCYIGLDPVEPITVKAVACAAVGVKKSAKLLEEINEVNSRTRMAHVYWDRGVVLVEQAIPVEIVDRGALSTAGLGVAHIANDIGPMIAAVYGGATPIPEAPEPPEIDV